MSNNFFFNLMSELKIWGQGSSTGNVALLTFADIKAMCDRAARATLGNPPYTIRLRREVTNELQPVTLIEDAEDGDYLFLYPEDVALLRALLLSYDEQEPARIGEPLTTPVRMEDGRVVCFVTEEMLNNA